MARLTVPDTDESFSQQQCVMKCTTTPEPCRQVTQDPPRDARQETLVATLSGSPPSVPCSFLYDTRGSELYEQITKLPEYYPFEAEKKLLGTHLASIAACIPADSVVLELGCGVADKTAPLLQALVDRHGQQGSWVYMGLDVSESALVKARENLLQRVGGLRGDQVDTVCAEYLEGVRLTCRKYPGRRVTLLWLGSSIGNLSSEEAVDFLAATRGEANATDIQMLLCTDLWKDTGRLRAAYDDSQGVTRQFILNGMAHAMRVLRQGHPAVAFDEDAWKYVVKVNEEEQQVEMWLEAGKSVTWGSGGLAPGQAVLMEISRKYTVPRVRGMAERAGFVLQDSWSDATYGIHLLVTPVTALRNCWEATEQLFASIPDWDARPIDLRHPLGFYYGHVAAFCKLKILGLDAVAAGGLDYMMSRGIDPLVTDPCQCHDHPPVPAAWPSKAELQQYAKQARREVEAHIRQQEARGEGVVRGVCLALEHEWMHQETMWHLLLQQRKAAVDSATCPAGGLPASPLLQSPETSLSDEDTYIVAEVLMAGLEGMAAGKVLGEKPNSCCKDGLTGVAVAADQQNSCREGGLVDVPGGMVVLGVPVDGSVGYVWDNEGPPQERVSVGGFKASRHAVSIGEYQAFVAAGGYGMEGLWREGDVEHLGRLGVQRAPATWSLQADGAALVHQLDGSFKWQEVADRPVWVSLAEAEAYAKWVGGGARIMAESEYCLALQQDPHGTSIKDLLSRGYEWTSTPFHPYPGFTPSPEYPEYSTEFFDGLHFALRGASPVTAPAMRRASFRNFYQRLYPFSLTKFRLVYPQQCPQQ